MGCRPGLSDLVLSQMTRSDQPNQIAIKGEGDLSELVGSLFGLVAELV